MTSEMRLEINALAIAAGIVLALFTLLLQLVPFFPGKARL
jgi:hypothetical protein